jgi:hypothetical protein
MFVVGDEVQSGDTRRSGSSRAESLALAQAVIPCWLLNTARGGIDVSLVNDRMGHTKYKIIWHLIKVMNQLMEKRLGFTQDEYSQTILNT